MIYKNAFIGEKGNKSPCRNLKSKERGKGNMKSGMTANKSKSTN
jgi:hypothetical protein